MCNTVNGQLIRLFVSYSREDQEFLDELTPTLKRCQRDFGIIVDSDVAVPKGRDWDRWISEAISSADVILCLISREYFASEYIVNNEVPAFKQDLIWEYLAYPYLYALAASITVLVSFRCKG